MQVADVRMISHYTALSIPPLLQEVVPLVLCHKTGRGLRLGETQFNIFNAVVAQQMADDVGVYFLSKVAITDFVMT